MAGTKESPRQKMIGMMYLVLTALLALQVSSAVIQKFQALNNSLEKSVKSGFKENDLKLSSIEKAVQHRGNKNEDIALKAKADFVSFKSRETVNFIEKLKKQLISETGGYDEDGSLKGAKEETEVEVIMIGPKKNGKAYELKEKLDHLIKEINKTTGKNYPAIALAAKDDPFFQKDKEQQSKDFAELNFGQTPLAASLAILTEFQSKITAIETNYLAEVTEKIGTQGFVVDQLLPKVSTSTKYVPAGTRYEANLFVAASASKVRPDMEVGGKSIEVDASGIGKVSFMAEGGSFGPDGMIKKVWTGKIKVRKADGTDTTYTISEEYMVTKPTMIIQAKEVSALYRNCKNNLNIQVPALGESYNPVFTATDAEVIRGPSKGSVAIVPKTIKSILKVQSNGLQVGEQEYRVKSVPKPDIAVLINGKLNPVKTGISVSDLRAAQVRAIAEKDFKEMMPEDATYKVFEGNIILKRSKTQQGFKKITSEIIDISKLYGKAQTGDYLLIEVTKVKRKNYKGLWEDVDMPATLISVPII